MWQYGNGQVSYGRSEQNLDWQRHHQSNEKAPGLCANFPNCYIRMRILDINKKQTSLGSLPLKCGVGGVCCASLGLWKDQTSASWRRYNQKGVYYLMSKARWWNILDTLQDEVETPWRKSLCKVVSKGEGSLEDLEPDGSTKSNLWSDAPFMSFTTLSRIVRGGVMSLQSRAVSHDRTVPTDRPTDRPIWYRLNWSNIKWGGCNKIDNVTTFN